MRADLGVMVALLIAPASAPQVGVVSGVVVPRHAQAGVPVEITVTGTNPCGAVRVDPGDGSERITHAITHVPTTVRYVYPKGGRFNVRAEGMGNCNGVATATIEVSPPHTAPSPAPAPTAGGLRDMDTDHDGVVTRAEWRGSDQAFRQRDTNNDGVLSGAEVREPGNEVIVRASDRWTNTGISVREGDVVRIESRGTVQLSADTADTSSPGGAGSGRRAPFAPLPDRPAGGLIARIGNAPPLFLGADSILRANASGQLYLGINDDHLDDNRGEFRVRIETPSRGRRR